MPHPHGGETIGASDDKGVRGGAAADIAGWENHHEDEEDLR